MNIDIEWHCPHCKSYSAVYGAIGENAAGVQHTCRCGQTMKFIVTRNESEPLVKRYRYYAGHGMAIDPDGGYVEHHAYAKVAEELAVAAKLIDEIRKMLK